VCVGWGRMSEGVDLGGWRSGGLRGGPGRGGWLDQVGGR